MPQYMARSSGESCVHKVLASACVMAIAGVLATDSIGVASQLLQAREDIWLKTCLERADNHQGLQLQSCDLHVI